MSKEKNQRYHSKIRALQHFGQQLTNADLEKMAEIYRHSFDTRLLKKQTGRVVKAVITYKGMVYPIVYDKKRHQIVTILKPDYLNNYERRIYDGCYARMLSSTRSVECNVSQPAQNINITIDMPEDVVEDTKDVELTEEPVHNEHVQLPTEEEGRSAMDEAMSKLNF